MAGKHTDQVNHMSALKARIQDDIKTAMKAGDKTTLGTLRQISAQLKQKEVDERIELTDDHVVEILDRMLKQRRESISQFESAGRTDLQQAEEQEVVVIRQYMPEQISESDLQALIESTIGEIGASSMADMGKIMGKLKPALKGRADMAAVSATVKQLLAR